MPSAESPVTSPEMGRRRYNYYNANILNAPPPPPPHLHPHSLHAAHILNNNSMSRGSNQSALCNKRYANDFIYFPNWNDNNSYCVCIRFSNSRSSHEIGRGSSGFSAQQQRGLYLELERERGCLEGSPPSDNVMFDNQCYATTPSSSNGNSDQDQPYGQRQMGNRHQHHHQVGTTHTHLNIYSNSFTRTNSIIIQFD